MDSRERSEEACAKQAPHNPCSVSDASKKLLVHFRRAKICDTAGLLKESKRPLLENSKKGLKRGSRSLSAPGSKKKSKKSRK